MGRVMKFSDIVWGGSWSSVLSNGEGYEKPGCSLPGFRNPPYGLNNDNSLTPVVILYGRIFFSLCAQNYLCKNPWPAVRTNEICLQLLGLFQEQKRDWGSGASKVFVRSGSAKQVFPQWRRWWWAQLHKENLILQNTTAECTVHTGE